MVHTHRRGDDRRQNPRQRDHGGATGPRPQSHQSRKGDSQSAGNRGTRSTSAKAPGEMRRGLQTRSVRKTCSFFARFLQKRGDVAIAASVTEKMVRLIRTSSYEDAADRVV